MNKKLLEITIKNTYDKISEIWDTKRRFSWDFIKQFLEKNFSQGKNFLDIGCGGGRDLILAKKIGYEIFGCDFSNGQIKICKNKNLNVKVSNLLNLKYKNNFFDVVNCNATFHHLLNKKDFEKGKNEIKRILKKNGVCIISVWFPLKKQIKKDKFLYIDENKKIVKVTFNREFDRFYYLFNKKEFINIFEKDFLILKNYEDKKGNFIIEIKNKN